MNTIINNLDFLGFKPSLYVNSQPRYRSEFTLILSIFVIILSIFCSAYFGSELFLRSSANVVAIRESREDFLSLPISNKGFLFLLGIQYSNNSYYTDPSIFQVEAVGEIRQNIVNETTGKYELNSSRLNIKMDLCSKFYTMDIIEIEEIKEIEGKIFNLDKLFCAEPDQFSIMGFSGSKTPFSFIRVNFNKCENSTLNNFSCKPQQQIDKIIQNSFISMTYTSFDLNQLNFTNPIRKSFYDDYNVLNSEASLEYAVKIEPLKFKSNNGIIFNSYEVKEGISYSTKTFTRFIKSKNIFSITFEGNPTGSLYLRNYLKLQNVATQIGGFIKIIMLVAAAISHVYSEYFFYVKFLNNILEEKETEKENMIKNFSHLTHLNQTHQQKKETIEKVKLAPIKFLKARKKDDSSSKVTFESRPTLFPSHLDSQFFTKKIPTMSNSLNYLKQATPEIKKFYLNDYFKNCVLFCIPLKEKSSNFKMIHALEKLYIKILSIDMILKRNYEIDFLNQHFKINTIKDTTFEDDLFKLLSNNEETSKNLIIGNLVETKKVNYSSSPIFYFGK